MKRGPLVSVIIPTFNREKYICDALESIINQTYQNWECIVVDDGSTDNTSDLVAVFCQDDARFQYYKRTDDFKKGANGSRNFGLSKSKGEYIGFCDDDDFWLDDKLEKQLEVFRNNPDIGLVTGNIEFVNADGIRTGRVIKQLAKNGYVFEDFLLKNRMSAITPLFKREVLKKVGFMNTNLTYYEDWEYWRRVSYYYKFYSLPDVLACVRKHDTNITAKLTHTAIEQFALYRKLTEETLKWEEDLFTTEDYLRIEKYEWIRYKQIFSNHCITKKEKLKFPFQLFLLNRNCGIIFLKYFLKYQFFKK